MLGEADPDVVSKLVRRRFKEKLVRHVQGKKEVVELVECNSFGAIKFESQVRVYALDPLKHVRLQERCVLVETSGTSLN